MRNNETIGREGRLVRGDTTLAIGLAMARDTPVVHASLWASLAVCMRARAAVMSAVITSGVLNEPVYPGHYYSFTARSKGWQAQGHRSTQVAAGYSEILHFGPIFPTINTYAPVGLSFRRAVGSRPHAWQG